VKHLQFLEELQAWDRGESIPTVVMGGISPGYEQAIQVLVVELVRAAAADPLNLPDEARYATWGDDVIRRLDKLPGFGFSGAQVGAAKNLALTVLRRGSWHACWKSAPSDRRSLVSRTFPQAPGRLERTG